MRVNFETTAIRGILKVWHAAGVLRLVDGDLIAAPENVSQLGAPSWHRFVIFAGKARSSATTSLTRTT
jgi:hypothetical protein